MFEFHGWAVIEVSEEADAAVEAQRKEQALEFVRIAVSEAQDQLSLFDVGHGGNGLSVVRLHGLRNHRRDDALMLFRRIAAELPASYGLLYIHDREAPHHDNAFRVFRMARGRVDEFEDALLSPRIPTIDDEFHPNA